MSTAKPYSLGKTERLKSRKQIDSLFESGKKIIQFPFRLIYEFKPGAPGLKAGFTVSSKNFPRAVDRNRIKRLTRESYRHLKPRLEMQMGKTGSSLQLFIIYTAREILSYDEVHQKLGQVLEKLGKTIHEAAVKNT